VIKKNLKREPGASCGQMTLLQLNYLPCGYKVIGSNGDEINSFLEGGEVDFMGWIIGKTDQHDIYRTP
jgi:hypothetical protein